jgi:GAF domain-containing protein
MQTVAPRQLLANRDAGGLEVLYKISNVINTTQDRAKVLKAIMREVVRLTRATSGSIAMLNAHRGILDIETAINIPAKTWKGLKLHLGVGVTGWAAYKGEAVRVDDVFRDSHYVAIKQSIRSELAVPMFLDGQVIGVINVDSTRRAAFTEEHTRLLQAVADQAAQVIATARLYEEQKRHNAQMEALFEVGRQLSSPAPVDAVLQTVVREGRALLKATVCAFVEYRSDKDELAIRAQDGATPSWLAANPIDWRSSLLGPVILHRAPLFLGDLRENGPFWGNQLPEGGGFRCLVAVPVQYQETLLGVLVVLTSEPRPVTEHEIRLLTLLASQTAAALENARSMERINDTEDSLHRVERFSLMGSLAA